jgi:hypothetical protein
MSEEFSEKIIDSFLEEMLTEQTPPDLSARISAAWLREQQLVLATPVVAPPSLQATATPGVLAPSRKPVRRLSKLRSPRRPRPSVNFQRNVVAVLLATGACGMLAVLGTLWIQQQSKPPLAKTQQSELRVEEGTIDNGSAGPLWASNTRPGSPTQSPITPQAVSGSESIESTGGATPLEIDNLPFALDKKPSTTATADVGNTNAILNLPSTTLPPPLNDVEIVRSIDQRMAQLWRALNVVPTAELPLNARLARVAQRLTNQPVLSDARAKLDMPKLVKELTGTPHFSQFWGEKLVAAWVGRSPLSVDDPRLKLSQHHMAEFISSGRPFNQIAIELLGGPIEARSTAPADNQGDTSLSATFVSALAGNGNHRLAARIGSSLLDANITCVRCHDNQSAEVASGTDVQTQVARQDVYWSLIAVLQGIDVQSGTGQPRVAVDRQSQMLAAGKPLVAYYDLLDGRLQAAQPLLPNGQPWNQHVPRAEPNAGPRAALAHWISQSSALDNALVNQVWRIVFGRPLVPHVTWSGSDPLEPMAQRSRRELQLFLAAQFRTHGHDLPRLVGWLVQSNAFSRENIQLNHAQWLDATDEELRRWQLADLNFAAGPLPPPTPEASSLEQSLAAVIQWKGDSLPSADSPRDTALAQPVPSLPRSENSRRRQAEKQTRAAFPGVSYALYGELPRAADTAFVSQLLASERLSWAQCVEHIVLLNASNAVSGRVRHLADELLRLRHGDARAALLDLLWAVRNSDSI